MFGKNRLDRNFQFNLSKFCQMEINLWLFRFLPFSLSRGYLMCIGTIYFALNRKEKKLIERTVIHVLQNQR